MASQYPLLQADYDECFKLMDELIQTTSDASKFSAPVKRTADGTAKVANENATPNPVQAAASGSNVTAKSPGNSITVKPPAAAQPEKVAKVAKAVSSQGPPPQTAKAATSAPTEMSEGPVKAGAPTKAGGKDVGQLKARLAVLREKWAALEEIQKLKAAKPKAAPSSLSHPPAAPAPSPTGTQQPVAQKALASSAPQPPATPAAPKPVAQKSSSSSTSQPPKAPAPSPAAAPKPIAQKAAMVPASSAEPPVSKPAVAKPAVAKPAVAKSPAAPAPVGDPDSDDDADLMQGLQAMLGGSETQGEGATTESASRDHAITESAVAEGTETQDAANGQEEVAEYEEGEGEEEEAALDEAAVPDDAGEIQVGEVAPDETMEDPGGEDAEAAMQWYQQDGGDNGAALADAEVMEEAEYEEYEEEEEEEGGMNEAANAEEEEEEYDPFSTTPAT